jgi:hypothetical protein
MARVEVEGSHRAGPMLSWTYRALNEGPTGKGTVHVVEAAARKAFAPG